MMHPFLRRLRVPLLSLLGLVGAFFLCLGGCAGQTDGWETSAPVGTPSAFHLTPGPNDPRIAYVAALLLENLHYSQRQLDEEMSIRFYDSYINALDPRHEDFLQTDLAEFNHYRTNLDQLTVGGHAVANLTPAFDIFNRFLERYQQHAEYSLDLLKHNRTHFTTNAVILMDRKNEPFPKDLAEAHQLWRQHLQYDYLQEKLARELSESNGVISVHLSSTNAADIAPTLARHYQWNLHQTTNSDSDTVISAYLNALTRAYDPHSEYLSAPRAVDFSINMSLSLFGIGASLSEDDGYCTVKSLVDGGPAKKSKQLMENDRIVAVAQSNQPPVDVVGMDLEKVIQMIRGTKGTEVRLTISPMADRTNRKVISLIRDEIKLDDAAVRAKIIDLPDGQGGTNRLGVLDVPSFYATIPTHGNEGHSARSTSDDVTKIVNKLKEQHIRGLIVDLRSNPGGSLEEAVRFTGLFIKDGPVVQVRSGDGRVKVRSDTDSGVLYDGPMMVLVNRFSASASEIAAAALQDYGRAVIVGDKSTHGKGTVQNLNELKPFVWPATPTATNDPGTIKITIDKFYRVTGASTQLKGVTPDIVLPDVLSFSKQFGESALENALPWDTIQPAAYDELKLVTPYLSVLSARSAARVATNQDFQYIQQDIADLQKHEAEKTVTLDENKAIEDRRAIARRNQQREDERNARPDQPQQVYDITLQNASQPGLPVPPPDTHSTSETNKNTPTDKAKLTGKKSGAGGDPTLDEAERIMEDYLSLLPRTSHLADVP